MLFADKVVLITDAASGIGRATALAFAQDGASVMVADVNDIGGHETVRMIRAQGGQADYRHTDVTQADAVESLVTQTVFRFGGLHYAINNAGIAGQLETPFYQVDESRFDMMWAVNVKGVWLGMKYETPAILQSGGGAIVNVASIAGLLGMIGGAIYSATKHAVIGLTKSTALEMAQMGVRVNAVCPSYTETPMVAEIAEQDERMARVVERASPMKRLAQPEEIAAGIVWLCSPAASFVNGHLLTMDGGLTAM